MGARPGDQIHEHKQEAINNYLRQSKKKIHEILMEKKIIVIKKKQKSQQIIAQEDKEVEVEEPSRKGYLNLSKHQRKPRTHKKCWICRILNHLKRSCPQINAFTATSWGM